MPSQKFYLLGQSPSSAREVQIDASQTFEGLQLLIAGHFAIVEPSGLYSLRAAINRIYYSDNCCVGISFQGPDAVLTEVSEVLAATTPVPITIDGHPVRDPPCPKELPFVGTFFEVYPDHLGNHQRLFEKYGPIIRTSNLGRVTYQTNDPKIAAIAFSESDFFTKKINESHPLYALKTPAAGVFLGDTDTPEWRVAHKFLPPALGPKAVRHYAPTMQKTVEDSFKVFDKLDEQDEAGFPGRRQAHPWDRLPTFRRTGCSRS